jgi:hypothetical protein
MGWMRNAYRIMVRKPEGKRTLRIPGIDGKIILEWLLTLAFAF